MSRRKRTRTLALLALVATIPAAAWAFDGPPNDGGPAGNGKRRTPPPQAYVDCQGKAAGDPVEITTPRGDTIAATCREFEGKLAAIPDHPPRFGAGQSGQPANP
jgi:hypothetical protein